MAWFQRKIQLGGVVIFRSNLPPRAEDFEYLGELGIRVERGEPGAGQRWSLTLNHDTWGSAALSCPRQAGEPVPRMILEFDPRLTQEERDSLRHASAAVQLRMEASATSGHILRDRKYLLRFANAICGTDGLGFMDVVSSTIWTTAAMQDELTHDADLDVSGIFVYHAITDAEGKQDDPPVIWAHTHGLREIGKFDFDLIAPSADAMSVRTDFMRAVAFAVLEDRVALDGAASEIVLGDSPIRFVSAKQFLQQAHGDGVEAYRDAVDDYHIERHGVACEDERKGMLGRLFGGRKLRPSRLVSSEFPDGMLMGFSDTSGALMADRARKTLSVFQQWREEFAEFSPTCIAKLGFETGAGGHEYPWFEIHAVTANGLDATCLNDPYNIANLKKGDRGNYSLEQLYDWMVMLPFTSLSPRSMPTARVLRTKMPELRKAMAAAQGQQ